jgi:hypothetical protein
MIKISIKYHFIILIISSWVNAEVLFMSTPFVRHTGYNTYRIPALIQASNGSILAFAEGRESPNDTGNIDLVLRRSLDGGITWKPLQVIWSDDANTCDNPVPVVDESNGRVWLFMCHNNGQDTLDTIVDGTSLEGRTIWVCYSDDNGVTWSNPVNRSELQNADIPFDATGPCAGYQIKRGRHVGRLVIPAVRRNIQSDDHGNTWYQSQRFGSNTGEATGAELSNGALYSNNRPSTSVNQRMIAYSYNQGDLSWTALSYDYSLVDSRCEGSVISYADSLYGYLLLFSNPAALTRCNMTVRVSFDDSKSWPVAKPIYRGLSGYSSLAKLSGGMVGLLFENGTTTYMDKISFAKFSLDWLMGHSIFRWDFEDYNFGSTIPTTAGAVHDIDGYNLNGTCSSEMSVVSGSSIHGGKSAVNFNGTSKITISDSYAADIDDFNTPDSFMIRVVFKTTSHGSGGSSGAGALVSKDVGPNQQSWWLRVQDGLLRFMVGDTNQTATVASSIIVNDDQWHEALVIRDAIERKLSMEIDGNVVGTAADVTKGSFANSNKLSIGKFNTGTCGFIGAIDEVQMYLGRRQDIRPTVYEGNLNNDSVIDFHDLTVLMNNWLSYN